MPVLYLDSRYLTCIQTIGIMPVFRQQTSCLYSGFRYPACITKLTEGQPGTPQRGRTWHGMVGYWQPRGQLMNRLVISSQAICSELRTVHKQHLSGRQCPISIHTEGFQHPFRQNVHNLYSGGWASVLYSSDGQPILRQLGEHPVFRQQGKQPTFRQQVSNLYLPRTRAVFKSRYPACILIVAIQPVFQPTGVPAFIF